MFKQPIEPEMNFVKETMTSAPVAAQEPRPAPGPRVEWGDALAVPLFYGREEELVQLTQWVVQEGCRVVSVLGLGGIGKSALSVRLMYRLSGYFEVVIFRSLRDAPSCSALLDDCLQVLSPQELGAAPANLERRISLLLSHLHKARVLVVLDNLECLLKDGDTRGHFRPGFEAYGLLLNRVAEASHQSCLLLTSRERPAELRHLEGRYSQVRSLRLAGLDVTACQQILEEKEVVGTSSEQEQLIEIYAGNPLALKIVTETIVDLFGGKIGAFLARGTVIFGSITDLLGEQFVRLSALEQSLLCWLAIARELMTLDELLAVLVRPLPRTQVLEGIDSLRRRSLIEPGKRAGSFTLQSVVLEYVTAFLIAEASHEIQQRRLDRLIQYGLSQAHAKEYVRQTQERLLVSPLLVALQSVYLGRDGEGGENTGEAGDVGELASPTSPASPSACLVSVEEQLFSLLDDLRKRAAPAHGYGPANLIVLLRLQRGNLNALDLSHLCIRGAYLQNVEMHEASLSGVLMRDSVFTQAVSFIWTVAISLDRKWWATGSLDGKVRVWREDGRTLHLVWRAHTDTVYTLAFSPDGRTLASGSRDNTVKLWDLESGTLLWRNWHSCVQCQAFTPDGTLLASSWMDATVRLWDPQSGKNLYTLTHPSQVFAVAFSPDGCLLASGCVDGEICLWERPKGSSATFSPILLVQTNWVTSLAFAPDGRILASTSRRDQTVKLWEVESLRLLHTLPGHSPRSRCVAWSPDGCILAYSSADNAIRIFDVEQGRYRAVLHGHTADVHGMAFTSKGTRLLSGSADSTWRVWDVENCRCMRVMQGYGVFLYCLDWSPDGTHLVSGGTDGLVTLWDLSAGTPPRTLSSHTWMVYGVGWSPDGKFLASCGADTVLFLWDPTSLSCVQRFEDSELIWLSMAWSPDGSLLACGTYQRGIQVWDVTARSLRWVEQTHLPAFYCVAWSPNSMQVVGGGDDGYVYLWESADRTRFKKLSGHQSRVMSVVWSPDGTRIASGSGNSSSGELFVWDVKTGECVQTFAEHPDRVYAVAWSRSHGACPRGDQLISGGGDGVLRWWDVESGECVCMQEAHQGPIRSLKVSPDGKFLASCGEDGAIRIWDLTSHEHLRTLRHDRPYERLNITGIRGLTEAQKATLQELGAIDEAEAKPSGDRT